MSSTPSRALLVIDVQNEYLSGGLRIEYPPPEQALQQVGAAMDAARAAGVPVIVVQQMAPPTSPLFAEGSDGWQLHPVVASRPHDHAVRKTLPGALTETGLPDWLRARGIDTLTLVGFMTHNCILSTAVDAVHRGLAVEVLADATGSVPYANEQGFADARTLHQTVSVLLQSRFAAVANTADWLAAVQQRQALPRSNIYVSHQAGQRLAASA